MSGYDEAKAINDAEFSSWVDDNEEDLIYEYGEQLDTFPESVYVGVLDDDTTDAEDNYCANLTIEQVSNDWLSNRYESHRDDVDDEAYERANDDAGWV